MFAMMPRRIALALLSFGIAGLAGCGDAPSKSDCDKLLAHLIDLEVAASGGKPVAETPDGKQQLDKQRKQVAEAASAKFEDACVDKTPKQVVDCALAAKTLDDIAKCDRGQ
jgi:hypothetical protein